MSEPNCIFCRIARRELPSHVVYESDDVLAFLDISPIRPGHVAIIPRQHHAYYDDVPPDVMAEIVAVGRKLAPVLRRLYAVPRVAFMFTGADIAHAHAHVVPMVETTDITSTRYIVERPLTFQPAPRADGAELQKVAESIRAGFSGIESARN